MEFVVTVKVELTIQDAEDRGDADSQALNYFLGQFGIGEVEVLDIAYVPESAGGPEADRPE